MALGTLLGVLFSVFTTTFTVASRQAVETDGDVPDGSQAAYSCTASTGQKGQMTAGNATTLRLTGWEGCCIQSVTLNMHSNKSAGAGSMQMRIGSDVVWQIADADFAHTSWNGEFSNSWVDISAPIYRTVTVGEAIEIHIEASKNSLFINSYTITYEIADSQPHTVSFVTGITGRTLPSLTEKEAGAGILLPTLPDSAVWHFAGWSEYEVAEDEESATWQQAGKRYYPKSDCTLWAVYSDSEGLLPVTDYQSGDYIITSRFWSAAMVGDVCLPADYQVRHKVVETRPIDILLNEEGQYLLQSTAKADMLYSVTLLSDSLLTIHNTLTGNPIGFRTSQLETVESQWHYRILEDRSLLVYHEQKGRAFMLTFGYGVGATCDSLVAYVQGFDLSTATADGLWLFAPSEAVFTTWPFGKITALPTVPARNTYDEQVMPFGIYEIRVHNGKKVLHLRK